MRSTISGSRAAFSITVVPCATLAAVRRFSVRAHAREVQNHVGSSQAAVRSNRVDESVAHPNLHAQLGKAPDVHVDLAGADIAAARHRDVGLAVPRDQRAENRNRGTHLRDHLIRRFEAA